MDVYDPQTLGIMVFGGFMVVSAIGIALVSTLSMKETSYEEALAKQRHELAKTHPPRVDKKKKASEKKTKAKKKEEKPNGKLPEQDSGAEPASETSELESDPEATCAPQPVPIIKASSFPKPVLPETRAEVEVVQAKAAVVAATPDPSPKDKKKKKVAKADPATNKPVEVSAETLKKEPSPKAAKEPSPKAAKEPSPKAAKEPSPKEPAPKVSKEQAPKVAKESTPKEPAPKVSKEQAPKVTKEPITKEPAIKIAKEPDAKIVKEQATKVAKEPVAKEPATKAAKESAAKAAKESTAKSTKEPAAKVAKEPVAKESVGKVFKEPAPKEASAKISKEPAAKVSKEPKVTKEQAPKITKETVVSEAVKMSAAPPKSEEPKPENPTKKKSKKKAETAMSADAADVPLLLPFKTLVATLSSSMFSESEIQKLLEIISDKAGADTWQMASQKGDPLAALKKQLEEKEKLLSAEQENATAAKTRLRELTKELTTEKSKLVSVETRMSSVLSAREQEITALHARMKASYDDHALQTQQLNSKIQSLQEQLENGPSAQLARLHQENTILRDALNQATSQAESRQNAELVKLRQECVHLKRELSDRTEAQNAEEEHRKTLESKVAAVEEQLNQAKAGHLEAEQALQQRLEQVNAELKQVQDKSDDLQTQLDKAQKEASMVKDLQERVCGTETELKAKCAEMESFKSQLTEKAPDQAEAQVDNSAEHEQLKNSLKEKEGAVLSLQEQLETMKASVNEAQSSVQQLQHSLAVKDSHVAALEEELKQLREANKQQETSAESLEAEQPFENLEKDARLISLEEELQHLREEMEQTKSKSTELREKNFTAVEALATAERLNEERLKQARNAQNEAEQKLNSLQKETRNALQTIFPHIMLETEHSNWLEALTLKAKETLSLTQREIIEGQNTNTQLTDMQQKLTEAENSQSTLQAQCDQYRTTLRETESILKDLQDSVEEGERVWKAKLFEAEEQCLMTQSQVKDLQETIEILRTESQGALSQVKDLEETIETLRTANQSTEQLKGQVMLLEAQLEKQLESISFSQTCIQEVEELKKLLSATQCLLESAQSEAQKQSSELLLVLAQLEQTEYRLQTEEGVHLQLEHNYEQAQKCLRDLEAQLEELKAAGEGSSTELKERLEKEVKLMQELSEAAVKLQQLLRSTQEELTKEKEMVKNLQEQLQDKEGEELKEGTSV
ncbi:ribosome-binding protein 1b isoform X2 [Hoplias malabaricus]|uniref:ribosome-binding protein 1-like isoform X2 n=1 Tax=Hoplias malabaricus TaxID=27720 RepID=UPI0034634D20